MSPVSLRIFLYVSPLSLSIFLSVSPPSLPIFNFISVSPPSLPIFLSVSPPSISIFLSVSPPSLPIFLSVSPHTFFVPVVCKNADFGPNYFVVNEYLFSSALLPLYFFPALNLIFWPLLSHLVSAAGSS